LSAGLAACSIAGLASAGGPELSSLSNGIKVQPERIAGVDRDGNMLTPWYYLDNQNDAPCGTTMAFDCFEPVAGGGAPTGGIACGLGTEGSRWFFTVNNIPSYCNLVATNDMSLATCVNVTESGHIEYGWYWYGDGNSLGSEQCQILVFPAEDWDDCNGFGNFYNGVLLGYAPLQTNPGGYYYSDVNTLCDSNLNLMLPTDGHGAYQIAFWQDVNNNIPATCAQPMLWGEKDTTGCTQGLTNEFQWDDDNPADYTYISNECYTYAFGLCPDPLGAMFCMLGEGGPTDCITLSLDRLVAGLRSTWTVSNLTPGQRAAIVWGTNLNGTSGQAFNYCYDFDIGGVSQARLLGQPAADANGDATYGRNIPGNLTGFDVYFQAAAQFTCPDPCMSNLLDETVQ
jgi:hypothetical protein